VAKQFIKDLKTGDEVYSEFLVTDKALVAFSQPNRAGEQFLRMHLADVTGTIRAVAWEKGPEMARMFAVGDIIRLRGEVGEYKGMQLVVYAVEAVDPGQVERGYFQRVAPRDSGEMLAELTALLEGIENPFLAALMQEFFGDREMLRRFAEAPAARSVHHNYIGGLLEHSLEVAAVCRRFALMYPQLDASLLVCGSLLHDIGKIEEYDAKSLTFELTTRGKLLGHIIMGKDMVDEKVARIAGFPQSLHMELVHMLLSHHGLKEWGSPEIPKTFNAYALFHADLVSARLNQFAEVVKKGKKDGEWTEWDRLLERSVYLGMAE